jgi:predicted MFS family arabinose efflux permease
VADTYGRKPTIMLADVLFALGAVVMGIAPSIAILILGRFIVGVSKSFKVMIFFSLELE